MRLSPGAADLVAKLVKSAVAFGLFVFFAYRAWYIPRPGGIPRWLRFALVLTGSILILMVAESMG